MVRYYANRDAQANGEHDVHGEGCHFVPESDKRSYLGEYTSCRHAVAAARTIYPQSNGCHACSPECHRK